MPYPPNLRQISLVERCCKSPTHANPWACKRSTSGRGRSRSVRSGLSVIRNGNRSRPDVISLDPLALVPYEIALTLRLDQSSNYGRMRVDRPATTPAPLRRCRSGHRLPPQGWVLPNIFDHVIVPSAWASALSHDPRLARPALRRGARLPTYFKVVSF